jgi:hypothetical protein
MPTGRKRMQVKRIGQTAPAAAAKPLCRHAVRVRRAAALV